MVWTCFISTVLKIQPFSPVSPLAESTAKTFCWLFLWNFEEKSTSHFYDRLCHSVWWFHLHSTVKIQPFSPVFPLADFMAEAFCWLFPWNFKEKGINHFLWYSLSVCYWDKTTIYYDRGKFLLKTWMSPHHGKVDSAGGALRGCRHPFQPFCFSLYRPAGFVLRLPRWRDKGICFPYIDVCFRENRKIR